jgi:lipopolysaccharide export system permease protein
MIWRRYFFKEILKFFFFFLLGFFFLYSVIEYSTHMSDFFKERQWQPQEVVLYYANQLLKRVDFLVPLALLLATIKVLLSLKIGNEWIVLQTSGLSARKLLTPFWHIACGCTLFIFLNYHYFLPTALRHIDEFRVSHFHSSHLAKRRELIHLIPLQDNTKLLYQSYDKEKNLLFDVLWIKSLDEMWHIKYLNGDPTLPVAHFADHIVRTPAGVLEKKESYAQVHLQELKWHPRRARQGLIPFEQRNLTELYKLRFSPHTSPYEIPKITTALLFRLFMPWVSPLLVMAIAPFCLSYQRQRHYFLLYALGIFGLFATYMLLDALSILSENSLLPPLIAIGAPFILLASFFTWRYLQKT